MTRRQVFDLTSAITWALIDLNSEVDVLSADVRDGRASIHIRKPGADHDEQLETMQKLARRSGKALDVVPGYFEIGDKATYTANGVEVFMIVTEE